MYQALIDHYSCQLANPTWQPTRTDIDRVVTLLNEVTTQSNKLRHSQIFTDIEDAFVIGQLTNHEAVQSLISRLNIQSNVAEDIVFNWLKD